MKNFSFPVTFSALDAAIAFHKEDKFIWLDSNRPEHPQSRYSYIVFEPTTDNINFDLDVLPDRAPFQGGVVGYRTYEGEDRFYFYDKVLAFDHVAGKAWFFVHAKNEFTAKEIYKYICNVVSRVGAAPEFFIEPIEWEASFSEEEYKGAVSDIIERILNGDIFQANLTNQYSAERPEGYDGFAHYLKLRQINPAPYSAYINFGDVQVLSSSPESFLSLSASGEIVTRPIKGTDSDAARLAASQKDAAENTMIVDLLRNDLSQICEDESVTVTKLCELQSFAGLHHLVSEVKGQVQDDVPPIEVLNACFPGGSITGAPKIEAMNVIDEIEQVERGVYCGSIGWIGIDGAMETSIAIRTITVTEDEISFGVGGGITAMSDPQSEYQETLLKADRIFKSFEG